MMEKSKDREWNETIELLRGLPPLDVRPALSEHIRAEAHRVLQRRHLKIHWKEGLARFYNGFLEPALVSSLVLFYTLWAFGRALQFLHL